MRKRHIASVWFLILIPFAPVSAQKPDRYINSLQGSDGGFRPTATQSEADLSATTSSLRTLRYLQSQTGPRDRDRVKEFVLRCYQPGTGSFALKPGMSSDVRSTATGLMALAELNMAAGETAAMITRYFEMNVKSLSDAYIAAAALDAARLTTAKAGEWTKLYEAARNKDGSYGSDPVQHAGAVITILRLGGSIQDRPAAAAVLHRAQRGDGGFSAKQDEPSDLSSSYRIMRACFMLREMPEIDRLRAYVAKCRNNDGGYGVKPGEPSSASASYFAAIISHWLNEFDPALPENSGKCY
jgi:prenyltransferase beta subunit